MPKKKQEAAQTTAVHRAWALLEELGEESIIHAPMLKSQMLRSESGYTGLLSPEEHWTQIFKRNELTGKPLINNLGFARLVNGNAVLTHGSKLRKASVLHNTLRQTRTFVIRNATKSAEIESTLMPLHKYFCALICIKGTSKNWEKLLEDMPELMVHIIDPLFDHDKKKQPEELQLFAQELLSELKEQIQDGVALTGAPEQVQKINIDHRVSRWLTEALIEAPDWTSVPQALEEIIEMQGEEENVPTEELRAIAAQLQKNMPGEVENIETRLIAWENIYVGWCAKTDHRTDSLKRICLEIFQRVIKEGTYGPGLPTEIHVDLNFEIPDLNEHLNALRYARTTVTGYINSRSEAEQIYGTKKFEAIEHIQFPLQMFFPTSTRPEDQQLYAEMISLSSKDPRRAQEEIRRGFQSYPEQTAICMFGNQRHWVLTLPEPNELYAPHWIDISRPAQERRQIRNPLFRIWAEMIQENPRNNVQTADQK